MTTSELQALLDRAKACGVESHLRPYPYQDDFYKGWLLDKPNIPSGLLDNESASFVLMGDVLAWLETTKYILELSQNTDGTWDGYASLRKPKRGRHPLEGAIPDGRIDPQPTLLHALVALAEKVKGASNGTIKELPDQYPQAN